MQFILRATIPVAAGNKLVKGNMEATLNKIMEDLQPKDAYFAIANGQRTIFFILEAEKATEIPRLAEPLWLALDADIEVIPTMSAKDFGEAGPVIGRVASRY